MSWISGSLVLALVLGGQVPQPVCEAPGRCVVELRAGDPAPFAGQLLEPEAALALVLQVRTATQGRALDRRFQEQLRALEQQAAERRVAIERERGDRYRDWAEMQGKEVMRLEAEAAAVWRQPLFWLILGLGLGMAAAGTTAIISK